MARIYATGMGPLPWEKPRLIHGSCSRTWQMVRPMLEAGHEVCLAAARVFDSSAPEDIPLVQTTRREGLVYYLADELKKFNDPAFHQSLLDDFRPDAFVAITTIGCQPLPGLRFDAPLWADIHGYVAAEGQLLAEQRQDNHYVRHFWKRYHEAVYLADKFSVTSSVQRHAMIGELGALGRLNAYTTGYEFVVNIPLARPDEEIKSKKTIVRGKQTPQDAFILLWLGGYNHWSDPETLFHGIESAMEQNERIHFVSTGGRIDGCDEKSFPKLQALVEKSRFKDRFHFQGWVESDDIPAYLCEADAGINVDRLCYESEFGARHRIVEMLRAAVPVITTRISEISREVEQAEAGLVCPVQSPEALAKCILDMSRKPVQRLEMGVQARELFQQKFTDEITVRPLLEWLENPSHAPDWGKDIPRREELLYEVLQSRSFLQKLKDHWKSRKLR